MEPAARESSRERMVRSAATLIRERGVHGVGMRQIVEHADAPRGSLQRYFPGGKTQLMIEGMDLAVREFPAGLDEAAQAGSVEDAVAVLLAPWRAQLVDRDFAWGCPVAPSVIDAAGNEELRVHAAGLFTAWQRAFARVFGRQPGISQEAASDLALMLITGIEGAVILSRAQRSTEPLDALERNVMRLAEVIAGAPE